MNLDQQQLAQLKVTIFLYHDNTGKIIKEITFIYILIQFFV